MSVHFRSILEPHTQIGFLSATLLRPFWHQVLQECRGWLHVNLYNWTKQGECHNYQNTAKWSSLGHFCCFSKPGPHQEKPAPAIHMNCIKRFKYVTQQFVYNNTYFISLGCTLMKIWANSPDFYYLILFLLFWQKYKKMICLHSAL